MYSSHKISKLIFEFSMAGDENKVKGLQSEIEQIISRHIEKVLDKPLNKFSNESVDIIIDKLEIDIGSFDPKNDKEKFFKAITEKIEQEISKLFNNSESENGRTTLKKKPTSINEIELIFYILRNGHLPWWADFNKKVNVNDFFKQFVQKNSNQQNILFKTELINPVFRKRLINYLSEDELIQCFNVLIPFFIRENRPITEACKTSSLLKVQLFDLLFQLPNETNSVAVKERLETMIKLLIKHHISPKIIQLDVLPIPKSVLSRLKSRQLSADNEKHPELTDAKEETEQEIKRKETTKDKDIQTENYTNDEKGNHTNDKLKNQTNDKTGKYTSDQTKNQPNDQTEKYTNNKVKNQTNKEIEKHTGGKTKNYTNNKTGNQSNEETEKYTNDKTRKYANNEIKNYTNDDETENSIEVSNAGLVLLLPFLSHFFENIGIAKNKTFHSEAEQHDAVYLLHYIATGNQDLPQEHELFFEKLICGIEVNDLLKPRRAFMQSHLDETTELLKSVIENWKALKNSSPKALQSAFLQRPGYLIQRDDGAWSLHIERQTIDILLNKLPWTISIGRLPFSNMMIYTEW